MTIISKLKLLSAAAYYSSLRILPTSASARIEFFRSQGYWPSIESPRSLNEYIMKRKLSGEGGDLLARYTDKILVKEIVGGILGCSWVNPTLWSGSDIREMDRTLLRDKIFIKANHGSGMNYLSDPDSVIDIDNLHKITKDWMKVDWPNYLGESWYNLIDRKIFAEAALPSASGNILDYKFFIINNNVEFIQVDLHEGAKVSRTIFKPDWQHADFNIRFPLNPKNIPCPPHFKMMSEAAIELASPFDFARVDFYDFPEHPIFGEITFAPGSGLSPYIPRRKDFEIGKIINSRQARGGLDLH